MWGVVCLSLEKGNVTSYIFHIIKTLFHKNLYNKLGYKIPYIHHVFQIILFRIRFNKISL